MLAIDLALAYSVLTRATSCLLQEIVDISVVLWVDASSRHTSLSHREDSPSPKESKLAGWCQIDSQQFDRHTEF